MCVMDIPGFYREMPRMIKEKETVIMNGKERSALFDNAKGVLIYLVVAGHFLLPVAETRLTTNLLYLIYVFHMPGFILISGYFSKNVYRDGKFRWDKEAAFLWLYLIFEVLVHITEGLLAGHVGWKVDFLHESGAPWYLLALLIWYLFIPVFSVFRKKPWCFAAMLLITAVGLYGGAPSWVTDFLAMDRVLAFAPFFFLGYFCRKETIERFLHSKMRFVTAGLAAFFAIAIFLLTYDKLGAYTLTVYGAVYGRLSGELQPVGWVLRLIWYGIALVMSLGLLAVLPSGRVPVLTTLGERTLQIYILHRVIRDLCQYYGLYSGFNVHLKSHVILLLLGCLLLTVFLGNALFFRIFETVRKIPEKLIFRNK